MKKLAFADGLSLPIDVVTQKLAFMGRTGSGKTYAAMKLAELLLAIKAQVIALDPVGVWWGLRLKEDGKTPAFDIPIFGGLKGDIVLEPTGGKLLADLVVDRALSCVIDVSQFESDADKARFARDFADRFFFRKKAAPSAVHLFIEEAQEFVPQNPQKEETRMLHAYTRMMKLGRNFGIGVSLISQRPQDVNKKVLNQSELLLAFQMTGVHERKRIDEWVKEKGDNDDVAGILPGLKVGQPHAWSPQWLGFKGTVKVLEKVTYDASSTPTFGAKAVESRPLAPIDMTKLAKEMAASIEKTKATDPKLLRERVAQLETALNKANQGVAHQLHTVKRDPEREKQLVDRAVKHAVNAMIKANNVFRRTVLAKLRSLQRDYDHIAPVLKEMVDLASQEEDLVAGVAHDVQLADAPPVFKEPARPRERLKLNYGDPEVVKEFGELTTPKLRILEATARLEAYGIPEPSVIQVALFVGISHTTGTYKQNVRELVDAGFLARNAGRVALTAKGRGSIDLNAVHADLDAPIDYWKDRLGGSKAKIVDLAVKRYPATYEMPELAQSLGVSHTTGTFKQNVRDLKTLGLLDSEKGVVRASDLLFPTGV